MSRVISKIIYPPLQIDTTISYSQPPYFFILFDDFALPNLP